MKTKQFLREVLIPAGAVLDRKKGDHHIYKLPSGQTVVLPMGGNHTEMRPHILSQIKKVLQAEAIKAAARKVG